MSLVHNTIQTVALRDVKCYAYHGYYPEEQLTGIYFSVDVTVTFESDDDTENLQRTVNYEILNNIILEEMKHARKMLETVVKSILDKVLSTYPFLLSIEVGIKKLNPPMPGQIGHSFVQLSYQTPNNQA
ncbi:dihydroneopterin aldolase [Pedobacter psychroterrae]|uniref:Dihydroneopterin aldolase n=1 Tax=Pedobacter psychroterrae TaxID=2530453 RepID=A0A4R0NHK7_9SPHI|nr:dihydroneopterin aldolase [Pedobacter psychroterrae]TCD00100.1 dihydroneopterin aldolase [Pedobacter psychroterrae]